MSVRDYLHLTFESFVYLSSIMYLYSRKIIAGVLSEIVEASHVVECIKKEKKICSITHPFIIHTDRGGQYVSDAFRKATAGRVNRYLKKHIHVIMGLKTGEKFRFMACMADPPPDTGCIVKICNGGTLLINSKIFCRLWQTHSSVSPPNTWLYPSLL